MSLLEFQRRMAADVRRPLTPAHRMQPSADDGRPMELRDSEYVKPNSRLKPFERLEIYNQQYWFRLVGAVAEDFSALNALLGAAGFDALILAYLGKHPSTSWTLRDLGAKLPSFVESHPDLTERRHRLATDVARLEWAYVDAYDGAHLLPLTLENLQRLSPQSRLSLQPHLRLLALDYPVDELVLAVRKQSPEREIVSGAAMERRARAKSDLPPTRRSRTFLAVHRFDDSVYYRRLDRPSFVLLGALRDGLTLSSAIAKALRRSGSQPEDQEAIVQQCFAHASELGWLCPYCEAVRELDPETDPR